MVVYLSLSKLPPSAPSLVPVQALILGMQHIYLSHTVTQISKAQNTFLFHVLIKEVKDPPSPLDLFSISSNGTPVIVIFNYMEIDRRSQVCHLIQDMRQEIESAGAACSIRCSLSIEIHECQQYLEPQYLWVQKLMS